MTEIEAESQYLARARAALVDMYTDVVSTETPEFVSGTDEVWFNQMYRLARARRRQDLVDQPGIPLFFGRLDYEPGLIHDDPYTGEADRVYIGRRHVRDPEGTPMVVDWRAPVSVPFYRATHENRFGVRLRRRYGFSDTAELTAYEDEPLMGRADGGTSALLAAEIERPRSGPMRDIVATIQPEQDELVRAPLQPSICVQGAPGTGKTAVGLHRLAYLLYAEPARLAAGVMVVGPNRAFLGYIRNVLPALGEVSVHHKTIDEFLERPADALSSGEAASTRADALSSAQAASARADALSSAQAASKRAAGTETPDALRLKGDARMAQVLRLALDGYIGEPTEDLVYVHGGTRYRVAQGRIAHIVAELRGGMRYRPGRDALAQRVASLVVAQMERRGATPDDRELAAVGRSTAVRRLVDAVWPKVTPQQVLFRLLTDAAFCAEAAHGVLTADEQADLAWTRAPRSARSANWSPADAVLLDEVAGLIDRTPSLSHIVVDEAQDLSPMQCRALGRRCGTGSVTVLGDIAQGTSPWAIDEWHTLLEHLGKPDASVSVLARGFRVPAQIIGYAARLLPAIAPDVAAPESVRRSGDALTVTATDAVSLVDTVVECCRRHIQDEGSIGVIAADPDVAGVYGALVAAGLSATLLGRDEDALETGRPVCVPAGLAKGLEFDTVVAVEPARIVAAEPRGLRRLYVVLTRAVTALHVIHAEPLPAELA